MWGSRYFEWSGRVMDAQTPEEAYYCAQMLKYSEPYTHEEFHICHYGPLKKRVSTLTRVLEYRFSKWTDLYPSGYLSEEEITYLALLLQRVHRIEKEQKDCWVRTGVETCAFHREEFYRIDYDWQEFLLVSEIHQKSPRSHWPKPIPSKNKKTAQEEFFQRGLEGCVYCGGLFEHMDHVNPRSLGGADEWTNLVPSCANCNMRKGKKNPWVWMEAVFPGQDHATIFKRWGVSEPPPLDIGPLVG